MVWSILQLIGESAKIQNASQKIIRLIARMFVGARPHACRSTHLHAYPARQRISPQRFNCASPHQEEIEAVTQLLQLKL